MCDNCADGFGDERGIDREAPSLRATSAITLAAESDVVAALVRLVRIGGHRHALRVADATLDATWRAGIGGR